MNWSISSLIKWRDLIIVDFILFLEYIYPWKKLFFNWKEMFLIRIIFFNINELFSSKLSVFLQSKGIVNKAWLNSFFKWK